MEPFSDKSIARKTTAPVPKVRLLELRTTYKWGGGPDKTILLSAERHDPSRVTVLVAYIRDVRDREFVIGDRARARGLNYCEIPERYKVDPRVLPALRDIVLRHDINLIHAHDYKTDLFAFLIGKWLWRKRIALISTAHAWVMLGPRGNLYRRLDLALMRRFDHLIAVSRATKREMIEGGVPAEKITVVHNAIDTLAWGPGRVTGRFRETHGLQEAFPVIGYVGRLTPEKDLETWLRVAARIREASPCARFVLVGEGRGHAERTRLEELTRLLGIADRVLFAGYHASLQEVYAAFDVFFLSSLREGLPNSILEAMAMGVPVVTTDVAGAKELVVDGKTGFVLPQRDVVGLSRTLLRLVGDQALRTAMGQAGRERVEREFCFTRRLRIVEDLYEGIVDSSMPVTPGSSSTTEVPGPDATRHRPQAPGHFGMT